MNIISYELMIASASQIGLVAFKVTLLKASATRSRT